MDMSPVFNQKSIFKRVPAGPGMCPKQDSFVNYCRLNGIAESQSAEQADIGNPYPPLKLVEMYKELFKKEWKDVLEVQKNSHKRKENDAMIRLSGILKVLPISLGIGRVIFLSRMTSNN